MRDTILGFAESGLLTWLLQIETTEQVSRDPLLGGDETATVDGIRIASYTETARLLFDES